MFVLPPNVTSLCQPMDQGVLESLKRTYCRKLLTVSISGMDDGESVTESLKQVDMSDAGISSIQNEIKPWWVKSWKKLLDHKATEKWTGETPKEINETVRVGPSEEGNQIAELVKHHPGCEDINNDQVKAWLSEDEVNEITDSDIV